MRRAPAPPSARLRSLACVAGNRRRADTGRALPGTLAGASLAMMLAACASAPTAPGPAAGAPTSRPAAASPSTSPASGTPRRDGGYYMDDGPGEAPPIALLAAVPDAEPRAEPLHRFANNPYVVFGRAYTPQREVQAFRQRGVGSWYGRKFHGQPTATGEAYDMYAMTAAHPTLPLPSYARVTNVANGRSVIVRVNDRGPFLHERVIDLSYTAAWKLGYLEQGSAHVEVETIVPGTSIAAGARRPTFGEAATASFASASATSGRMRVTLPPAQPAEGGSTVVAPAVPGGVAATAPSVPAESTPSAAGRGTSPLLPVASEANGVFLQLGAFSARENAEAFRAHVARMLPWVTDPINLRPSRGLVRVQLGPYADAIEAMAMAERIRNALDVRPVVTR